MHAGRGFHAIPLAQQSELIQSAQTGVVGNEQKSGSGGRHAPHHTTFAVQREAQAVGWALAEDGMLVQPP
jgi:hypothetical protein